MLMLEVLSTTTIEVIEKCETVRNGNMLPRFTA
jgi:hypothetical protein